ncbi:MAG TPA: alpha-amylase, partial [Terracidiphilus sp.]
MALMEFHISREARNRYQVEQTLFSFAGNVVFGDLKASRELTHRMNQARGTEQDPDRAIHPGALFAMGLIDEASHLLMHYYRKIVAPRAIGEGLQWFSARVGAERVNDLLMRFVQEFPGTAVYRGEQRAQEWLAGSTDGIP